MTHTVMFLGAPRAIAPLTAGQLATLAPLVVRLRPHCGPEGIDLGVLFAETPAMVAAAAQVLGATEAEVGALPLAAFADLVGELAQVLVAVNAPYLAEELVPAVGRLSARVTELTAALAAPGPA